MNISELRKEFEAAPLIACELSMFNEICFDEELGLYVSCEDNHHLHAVARWLNGAWRIWKSKQSEIDQLKSECTLHKDRVRIAKDLMEVKGKRIKELSVKKPPLGNPFDFDLLNSYKEKVEQLNVRIAKLESDQALRLLSNVIEQKDARIKELEGMLNEPK